MQNGYDIAAIRTNWNHILGTDSMVVSQYPERELWLIQANNERSYYLKRLGPWRNLPLADEARVLRFLSGEGINVAEFIPTDSANLYAGEIADSFVFMFRLPGERFNAKEVLAAEEAIGARVTKLHVGLSNYPWFVDSYTEDLKGSLEQEQMLPSSLATLFETRRADMISAIEGLPTQLVHGDLTPENIILHRPIHKSGFIDFEHLPTAPRIWDVAKFLSRRLRMRWREDDQTTHHRIEHIAPFLHGYQGVSPLSSRERNALPVMIAAANIIEVSYFSEIATGMLDRRMLSDHDEVLADSIEAAEWHLTHWHEVVDATNRL